jgi:hypothetical protein
MKMEANLKNVLYNFRLKVGNAFLSNPFLNNDTLDQYLKMPRFMHTLFFYYYTKNVYNTQHKLTMNNKIQIRIFELYFSNISFVATN